ncbi:MAG TPA: hypothetical protein VK858_06585 [Longimicrobiales bacterium]|nr:hypothetical protein [Longimicrobiales bacterium]
MRLALQIVAIDPGVRGVLILGHRGTDKSTAVRGLPELSSWRPVGAAAGVAGRLPPRRR